MTNFLLAIAFALFVAVIWQIKSANNGSEILIASANATDSLISHSIVDREELGSKKLSLTVEVPLIGDRLPTEAELGDLSKHLVGLEQSHDRTFVTFYLPDMEHGAGAFATAHHNPKLEIKILHYMLGQYRKYARFAQ